MTVDKSCTCTKTEVQPGSITMGPKPLDPRSLRLICRSELPGYDFKTSTGVGLRYSAPVPRHVENRPAYIPPELRGRDPLVDNNGYRPIISGDLDLKLPEPFDKADKVPCKSMLYIKPYGEKVKANPPNPPDFPVTETREQYQRPWPLSRDRLVDLRDDYLCRVKRDTSQSPLCTGFEFEGALRLLDPYNSITHLDYHYIHQRDADFFKKEPKDVTPILSIRKKPIYDKMIFKNACFNNTVYKPPRFVPNFALKSETIDKFRHPLTMSDLATFDPGVEFGAAPHAASRKHIMATPAMYLTEYTHISEGWPVNACVQYGNKEVEVIQCEN